MRKNFLYIILFLILEMGNSCLLTGSTLPSGINVSNRCSLVEKVVLASWEDSIEGFLSLDAGAELNLNNSLQSYYEGESCLEIIFPDGISADLWRTVYKNYTDPIDLSETPMMQYGILISEGPGRGCHTRLTLRSSDGKQFCGEADIIPTLWQSVIFDIHECPFLNDIVSIEISVNNDSHHLWSGVRCMVDGFSAGKPLDLDFEIPDSEAVLRKIGDPDIYRSKGIVSVDFKDGDAIEIETVGSHNNMYSPLLEQRNTVMIALENYSSADSLRLYFATDNNRDIMPGNSKTVAMAGSSGLQLIKFNLSDKSGAKGRLSKIRIEPVGGCGTLNIDRISFEREDVICHNAGEITSCKAVDNTVTIEGCINGCYVMEGGMIEVRHAPFWQSELPFDSLEKVGECQARSNFKITDIPNSRHDGKMSHLSSRFKAALRLPDGTTVPVGEPFFIENWSDFIDNPYSFSISGSDYSVNDFGATGDGITNDNAAIQRAIDTAFYQGGGRVILNCWPNEKSERQYIATNLELRRNVELVIERGVVLRQSPRHAHYVDYPPEYGHDNVIPGVPWTHCMYTNRPFILAKDTENVKITGGGKIRMDDTYSENPAWLHYARTCSDRIHIVPIAVCNTRHVEICDIDIVRCSNYHTIFYRADSVFIGNLKMYDVSCLSGDGLSFGNAVTNVRVARCVFESNDDGIVLCNSYMDPRGGDWRERVDSIDSSVRHIEVLSSYIDSSRGGAGKAIAIIPWGSTNPRQDFSEIDNIEVRDCVLKGGHSIGTWPDNPFDGKPFDNTETDDYAPVKNLRIFDNEYLSSLELNGVEPTTLLKDCGLSGADRIKNNDFTERLAYWSNVGNTDDSVTGEIKIIEGLIYQGIHLDAGHYQIEWNGKGEIFPEVKDMYGNQIEVYDNGRFVLVAPMTVLIGIRGCDATITTVSVNKIE